MRDPSRRLAALASVVLMGCSSVGSPSSSSSPIASSAGRGPAGSNVAPATPAPTAAPSPTGSPTWAAVPKQADVQAVQFQDVVWTGSRFVAVGIALAGGGAFLESSDGLTWHLLPDGPTGFPMRLASGRGGLVAVGRDADGRPVSWHSNDGVSWSAASATFAKASGDRTIEVTDVVATEVGWLAVGREDPACQMECGLDPIRALVWPSDDGLDWTRVADQPALRRGAMRSVARTGVGFVAVGSSGLNAAAWTSTDGTTWTAAPDGAVFHPVLSADGDAASPMLSVAVGHGFIVAVGTEYPIAGSMPPTARGWWSLNGVAWHEAEGDRFPEGQLFAVAGTPNGFLATGPSRETSCFAGVWASADGRSWRCTTLTPENDDMGPYAAAASSTIEIVVGLDASSDSEHGNPGGVWWRPLE